MTLNYLLAATDEEDAPTHGTSVVYQRDKRRFEVWGENISDHFFISYPATDPQAIDIVFLPGQGDSVAQRFH